MKIIALLPWVDWLALGCFFMVWAGYAWFARHGGRQEASLMATTSRYRRAWMLESTSRDPRILDGIITQSLATNPSFFASTSIFVIGALFALLGTTDKAAELVHELPFAQATPMLVFEFKVVVLIGIFVYSFFRFTWSMRQYVIAGIVIGAMPSVKTLADGAHDRTKIVARSADLLGLAADTFNDGLRAYYFSFAVLAWFFSPVAFMGATALVILVLYGREFRSDVLRVLNG
jgi:uncharacterized membrane protein